MKVRLSVGILGSLLCFGSALAADLPPEARVPEVANAAYHWSGWYVGLNAGASLSRGNMSTPQGDAGEVDIARLGATGGVQAGYNWQFSPHWVAGVEADFGHLGSSRRFVEWNDDLQFGTDADWYGTVRGRLGYSTGPSLLYLTGGAAFVNVENTVAFDDGRTQSKFGSRSKVAPGWTLGGGIETMLGSNWSAKAEYLYIDAGDAAVGGVFVTGDVAFENRFHAFRVGLNYRPGMDALQCCSLGAREDEGGHDWTGWYAGINVGTGLSQVNVSTPSATNDKGEADIAEFGLTGGVQAGFDWQFSPHWVAGVEADFGHLGINRSFHDWNDNHSFGVDADWYGTVRGRLGYTTGPSLLYITGGAAFVNVKNIFGRVASPTTSVESSKTGAGWTLGGGIETMLGGNWSAKAEYLYIDAGEGSVDGTDIGRRAAVFENRFQVTRVGLSYRFGG